MKIVWVVTGETATIPEILACVGKGWHDIIIRLIADLEKLGWDGQLFQMKEKFGSLRFYIGSGSTEIFNRIDRAEEESSRTCEVCGEAGTQNKSERSKSWIQTLCKECAEK